MTRRSLLLALLLAALAGASAVSLAGTFGVPLNGTVAFYDDQHGAGSQGTTQLLPPFGFIGLNSKFSSTKVDDEW